MFQEGSDSLPSDTSSKETPVLLSSSIMLNLLTVATPLYSVSVVMNQISLISCSIQSVAALWGLLVSGRHP